jgi:fibronectin-binding autotransporter adhesin
LTLSGTTNATYTVNPTTADLSLAGVTGNPANGQTLTLVLGGTSTGNTLSGNIAKTGIGTVNINKSGTGTWTLSNTGSAAGITTLSDGQLNLNSVGALGTTGGMTLSGGILDAPSGPLTLTSNGTVTISGNFTFGGTNNITFGTGSVNFSGSSNRVITLNGTGSTLAFGGSLSNTTNAAGSLTVNGAGNTLQAAGLKINSGGTATFTLTLGGSANILITGPVINGNGGNSLAYSGPGVLTLGGTNLYTGTTTINAGGTIQVGNGGTTGDLGTSMGNVTDNGTLAFNRADDFTWSRVIAGSGSLTQKGSGALSLSAANTLSGQTAVTAGSLILTNSLALQNSVVLVPASATALQFDSTVATHAFSIGGLTGGNNLVMQDNASPTPNTIDLTIGGTATSSTYNGIISGGGTLTKTGSGALALTNLSTYSGATTVNKGALRLLNSGLPSVNSNVNLTATGTVEITGNTSLTVGTGANQIQLTGATVGFGAYGGDYTLDLGAVTWGSGGFAPSTALQLGTATSSGKVALAGTIDLGGVATRLVNVVHGTATGPDAEISGTVTSASGAILKINGSGATGLLKLSGDSTYDGPTWVNQGGIEVSSIGNWGAGNTTPSNLGSPTTAANGAINLGHGSGSNTNPGTLRYVGPGETTNRLIKVGAKALGDDGGVRGIVDASGTGPLVASIVTNQGGTGGVSFLTLTGTNTQDNTTNGAFNDGTGTIGGNSTITKAGIGSWVLTNAASSYQGGTVISDGILVAKGNQGASASLSGTFTNGSATITGVSPDDIAKVTVGDMLYGWNTNTNAAVAVTAIDAVAGTVTMGTTTSNQVTGVYTFEKSTPTGIFGRSHGALVLGNADTTTNNGSPSLLIDGAYTIAHPVTIADQATTGAYTLGGRSASDAATFSGLITMHQPLTVSQTATTDGNALNITGGITTNDNALTFAGAGDIRVTTALSTAGNLTKSGAGTLTTDDIVSNGLFTVSNGSAVVAALSGNGSTAVGDNASLSADSIVQDTLTIGAGGSVIINETPSVAGQSNVSQVPEPGLCVLLCAGAVLLLPFWRRARRAKN